MKKVWFYKKRAYPNPQLLFSGRIQAANFHMRPVTPPLPYPKMALLLFISISVSIPILLCVEASSESHAQELRSCYQTFVLFLRPSYFLLNWMATLVIATNVNSFVFLNLFILYSMHIRFERRLSSTASVIRMCTF